MPRPSSTCYGPGVAEPQRCPACLNVKAKSPRWRNSGRWPQLNNAETTPNESPDAETSAGTSSQLGNGSTSNAGPADRQPSAANSTSSAADTASSRRRRKQPVPVHVPEEHKHRLPLSAVPKRKAVQNARSAELAAEREEELDRAREEAFKQGVSEAEGVVAEAKARLNAQPRAAAQAVAPHPG